MFYTFIDVREPLLNVYQDDWESDVSPGATIDFGLEKANGMRGSWRVLSIEPHPVWMGPNHPWRHGIRVNVERHP